MKKDRLMELAGVPLNEAVGVRDINKALSNLINAAEKLYDVLIASGMDEEEARIRVAEELDETRREYE